jgi:hypothetical protein
VETARRLTIALGVACAALAGCQLVLDYPPLSREHGATCDDGMDNDLDGLVDAADEDCASTLGDPCRYDEDCDPLVCGARRTGVQVCTDTCSDDHACPAGWSCNVAAGACACSPCAERCNGADDDCDGSMDEETCALGEVCREGSCACDGRVFSLGTDELDLLFVMDDSSSMSEEQESLTTALPAAIAALATGDLEGDGIRDFSAVGSLHVGVVTTDMGLGTVTAPGCGHGFGDDGILRAPEGTCAGSGTSAIFDFESLRDLPATFASDVACVLATGTAGCGFEQQLEAPLKALSPAAATDWVRRDYVPPTFFGGASGHGDGANAGFLRTGSVLAIVVVTDDDDCSAVDPALFDPSDPRYAGTPLNLRCFAFPEQTYPVERYVDGFLQLRRDPGNLLFAAIVGVPVEAAELSFEETLALPAMQERQDPELLDRLLPSCVEPSGHGLAYPPRRIVEVAEGIECGGGQTSVHSICETDFSGAFARILEAFSQSDDRRVCIAEP